LAGVDQLILGGKLVGPDSSRWLRAQPSDFQRCSIDRRKWWFFQTTSAFGGDKGREYGRRFKGDQSEVRAIADGSGSLGDSITAGIRIRLLLRAPPYEETFVNGFRAGVAEWLDEQPQEVEVGVPE
jgi:hypothetical protein